MSGHFLTIKAFSSAALKRDRMIRILLPHCYSSTVKHRYPVLYVHDAQNLFEDTASYSGQAWQLDRIVDELISSGQIEPLILVAIDHADTDRLAEFAHQDRYFDGQYTTARGSLYEQFLAEELKPHIDQLFLTRPEAQANALMGSSMGGLVSLNIALRRSHQFGAVAALSPSCWWNSKALKTDLLHYQEALVELKVWLDIGGREGRYGEKVKEIAEQIIDLSGKDENRVRYYLDPDAVHSESAWRNRVHLPLKFLFGARRQGHGAPCPCF